MQFESLFRSAFNNQPLCLYEKISFSRRKDYRSVFRVSAKITAELTIRALSKVLKARIKAEKCRRWMKRKPESAKFRGTSRIPRKTSDSTIFAENRRSPICRHQTLSCTITIMCMTEMSGYQPFCLWSRLTHRLQRDYAARQAYTDSYLPWSQWLK